MVFTRYFACSLASSRPLAQFTNVNVTSRFPRHAAASKTRKHPEKTYAIMINGDCFLPRCAVGRVMINRVNLENNASPRPLAWRSRFRDTSHHLISTPVELLTDPHAVRRDALIRTYVYDFCCSSSAGISSLMERISTIYAPPPRPILFNWSRDGGQMGLELGTYFQMVSSRPLTGQSKVWMSCAFFPCTRSRVQVLRSYACP